MEEDKLKEYRRLMTTLESNREVDQLGERDRLLARNRQVYKFLEIKKTLILPALRQIMVDLDSKGHLTRLQEKTPERVRFDVQIQTRTPKRGAIEIALHPTEGAVKVAYAWSTGETLEEQFPLDKIESGFVTDRFLHLLKRLL